MTNYKICSETIMDTSDPDITFDINGVSNHVSLYAENKRQNLIPDDVKEAELARIVREIKKDGEGKEYDCIIGLSGGADSSYVAYIVKKLGLRALAVHLDNGWNSELAVHNIERIVKTLGLDLYTYVINWDEFKDYQKAFLSCLILSGQMTREVALIEIEKPLYTDFSLREDIEYFIKKFNLTEEEFDEIMNTEPIPHHAYPSYDKIHKKMVKIYRFFIKRK